MKKKSDELPLSFGARVKKLYNDAMGSIACLIMLLLSPFIVGHYVAEFKKDLPRTWVYGWQRLQANALCIVLLICIAIFRQKSTEGWAAFLGDGLFLVVALKGVFLNFWDLLLFVLLPRTPGITQWGGDSFLDKLEKWCKEVLTAIRKKVFPEVTNTGLIAKLGKGAADFGFEFGRKYVEEILVRGSLTYLSMRFILLLLFIVCAFTAAYDWLNLVTPLSFSSAGSGRSIVDFLFFSIDILTTSSISGVSAATHLAKAAAASQLGLSFLALVLFAPLIFTSYDRAIYMSEEFRKIREKHFINNLSEFIELKTGMPAKDAKKLLKGEMEEAEIDKLGINIEIPADAPSKSKEGDSPKKKGA